jgi:hypothetical protein
MNDFDLESKIRGLRVPERDEDYWEDFPRRVLTEMRSAPAERPAPRTFMPGLLWCGRVAVACLVAGFCLWQSRMPKALSHALLKNENEFRQSVARFENNLGTLMQDEHGLHRLIEDQS